jgi:hypothetical protein
MEDILSDHNYIPQGTEFIECKKKKGIGNNMFTGAQKKKDLKILTKRRKKFGKQWKDFVF